MIPILFRRHIGIDFIRTEVVQYSQYTTIKIEQNQFSTTYSEDYD